VLHIVNLEEIQGTQLRIPALIRALEARDPDFIDRTKTWLTQSEQILANNRLAVAGGVAALRGILIAAERGAVPTDLALSGRLTPRKIKIAAAADAIRKAEVLISGAVKADAIRIAEAERLVGQIVGVARQKQLIPAASGGTEHGAMLRALWQALSADSDTGAAAVRVNGLVGMQDALILLDRMVTELA